MSFGKELVESAREALAIAEGKLEPGAVHIPDAIDVAAIRNCLGLSQADFSDRFGLPVGTVRDWEQGRRVPDKAAQVLLSVIAHNPDAVTQAIAAE